MRVTRPEFNSPVLCIDDFLSDSEASEILAECIELESLYEPATILLSWDDAKVDKHVRSNLVVYLDKLFSGNRDKSRILRILSGKFKSDEFYALGLAENSLFKLIRYSNREEAILSRYGEGDFYKPHRDASTPPVERRIITIVYYVNTIPQRFEGGALTFISEGKKLRIETTHNRAVVFPSFLLHEVEPVKNSSDGWKYSRFSINYWFGYRQPLDEDDGG